MRVDNPQFRRTATILLGVFLLAAAVFAPLGAIAWSYEYTAEQVEPDDPQLDERIAATNHATSCYAEDDVCDLANSLRDNDSRIVTDTTYRASRGIDRQTEVVVFPDSDSSFYRLQLIPYENETAKVSLTPISNTTALELTSRLSMYYPQGVQKLVDKGQIRTDERPRRYELWSQTHDIIPQTNDIIAHDGDYYQKGAVTTRDPLFGNTDVYRLILLVIGAALCYRAGCTKRIT